MYIEQGLKKEAKAISTCFEFLLRHADYCFKFGSHILFRELIQLVFYGGSISRRTCFNIGVHGGIRPMVILQVIPGLSGDDHIKLNMRIGWRVFSNASNFSGCLILTTQNNFSKWILCSEISLRSRFRYYNFVCSLQCCAWVSGNQGKGKELKEV